jgi:hypothetical protein
MAECDSEEDVKKLDIVRVIPDLCGLNGERSRVQENQSGKKLVPSDL